MYPVCTGSAALQRRVRRGQTSAKPLRSKTSGALAIFFLPLLRGPKGPHYPHGRIHQLWNGSKLFPRTPAPVRARGARRVQPERPAARFLTTANRDLTSTPAKFRSAWTGCDRACAPGCEDGDTEVWE